MTRIVLFSLLLAAVGCTGRGERGAGADKPAMPAALRDRPAWLFEGFGACPADVMGDPELALEAGAGRCAEDLDGCVTRCREGQADICYMLALHVERIEGRSDTAEALFLRACAGGVTSGCTNRAAALLDQEKPDDESNQCAARTFDKTCERRDAWGCAMLASVLSQGIGIDRDLDRALEVLPTACRFGPDDAACQEAQRLEALIRAQRQNEAAPAPAP